jgi:rhamnose transport system permease protein
MKAWNTWERVLLALLVLLLVVFGLAQPGFMTPYALADSTFNFSEKGILALALALLIVTGEIDLSIAAILALCSLAMGYAMKAGAGPLGMTLAAFATGGVAGAVNGVLVTRYKLPSIVVTIGTLSLYRGLAMVALGDQAISGYPGVFSTLGNSYVGEVVGVRWLIIPIEFTILLVAAIAVGVTLHRTVLGRRLYAIGALLRYRGGPLPTRVVRVCRFDGGSGCRHADWPYWQHSAQYRHGLGAGRHHHGDPRGRRH